MSIRRMAVRLLAAVALSGAFAFSAGAQASAPRTTPRQAMANEAKVSRDQARITALMKVPGGRMSSIELKSVMGKLVYSALIAVPGRPGMTEVTVDAMTGIVLSKRP